MVLTDLYDHYANGMFRLALSYLKNVSDAEDVVQMVFTKLIEGKATLIEGKERALLTQMTVNQCKDCLRAFWRRKSQPLDDRMEFQDPQDRELFQAVMSLPDKYRVVIYLHYYENYALSEISSFLHIGVSAVSMRLHRGRNLLMSKLEVDDLAGTLEANF